MYGNHRTERAGAFELRKQDVQREGAVKSRNLVSTQIDGAKHLNAHLILPEQ